MCKTEGTARDEKMLYSVNLILELDTSCLVGGVISFFTEMKNCVVEILYMYTGNYCLSLSASTTTKHSLYPLTATICDFLGPQPKTGCLWSDDRQ